MFEYETRIRMHHTDAAGVTFFADQFALAHDAYEAFLESRGLELRRYVYEGRIHLPIVRAEADYHAPVRLGDRLRLRLTTDRVGDTSFVLRCRICRADDETLASELSTVHVAIDSTSQEKVSLPADLEDALESIQDWS